jgi:hypothetical protein
MKIILLDTGFHDKNRNALLSYKNIQTTIINNVSQLNFINLNEYDAIYSPSTPIYVSQYPTMRFIFGPHFSVFPDNKLHQIKGPNTIYIQPSPWAAEVWKRHPLCRDMDIRTVPFGVDTEKFCEITPITDRTKVFVYYKNRKPEEIGFIINFLNAHKIEYRIFSYATRYSEHEYLCYLQESKYGIWVDAHESQGFALEEALSCNVPLFVWDVVSMNQAFGYNCEDLPATTIPYWNDTCGEVFYNTDQIDNAYTLFMSKLYTFNPRQYILSSVSMEKCEQIFINLLHG